MAFAKVIITGGEGGVMESSMNPNILETQSNSLYEISISKVQYIQPNCYKERCTNTIGIHKSH